MPTHFAFDVLLGKHSEAKSEDPTSVAVCYFCHITSILGLAKQVALLCEYCLGCFGLMTVCG